MVAKPPKHVTKERGKNTKTTFCIPQCKHKGKETDSTVQCHMCQLWIHYECVGESIFGVWSCLAIQLADKLCNLEETLLQLKENKAELIKLVKAQCNANYTIVDKNCDLVEKVTCLRNEINHGNEIRAMNDKLDKLSSDFLSQSPIERESYVAVTNRKTSRVFMFDDQIVRDMHKVTTADNELVALHTTSRATPKDLLIVVQWTEVCKEADELTIVCSEVVTGDGDMTQVKQDFSDLITSASENVSRVTIRTVLLDTTRARYEMIKEINNFLKDTFRDTGARFVDNDHNLLFRDGSCDTSAFQNDGVHLSTYGVKRLMSNFSLGIMPQLDFLVCYTNVGHSNLRYV